MSCCPAWANERAALVSAAGMEDVDELSLSSILRVALEDKKVWTALSVFAGSVMRSKEEADVG